MSRCCRRCCRHGHYHTLIASLSGSSFGVSQTVWLAKRRGSGGVRALLYSTAAVSK